MPRLVIATLSTRNFDFEGVGTDEPSATSALEHGLRVHGAQTGLAAGWWQTGFGEFEFRTIEAGAAYRDGERLPD